MTERNHERLNVLQALAGPGIVPTAKKQDRLLKMPPPVPEATQHLREPDADQHDDATNHSSPSKSAGAHDVSRTWTVT